MQVLHPRCAGLDVHKDSVVAAVRLAEAGGTRCEVRSFDTTTPGLLALGAWLAECGCTHAVMEATGVYWKPVWHLLSDGDLTLVLANAAHVRNVPGRKTDVADAAWLADLLAHGLIRPSFVPEPATQALRALLRTRKQLRACKILGGWFHRHAGLRQLHRQASPAAPPLARPRPVCGPATYPSEDQPPTILHALCLGCLVPPAPQQPQQRLLVRLELLERLPREARDDPGHQPAGLAQFDDRDQRAVLVQGDEGPAQVFRPWHGASPSACVQRRWCSTPGAAP